MLAGWTQRFFVLDSKTQTLKYYENEQKKKEHEKGSYTFNKNSKVTLKAKTSDGHAFQFEIRGRHNGAEANLMMSADSVEIRNKWKLALDTAARGEPLVESVIVQEAIDFIAEEEAAVCGFCSNIFSWCSAEEKKLEREADRAMGR